MSDPTPDYTHEGRCPACGEYVEDVRTCCPEPTPETPESAEAVPDFNEWFENACSFPCLPKQWVATWIRQREIAALEEAVQALDDERRADIQRSSKKVLRALIEKRKEGA